MRTLKSREVKWFVQGHTAYKQQNLYDPRSWVQFSLHWPRLPVLSGDLVPHKQNRGSEMYLTDASLMHVGKEVKCAEWGIMMINTWITGFSRILLPSCPFPGRTASRPAQKEDTIRKDNLLKALSNLLSGLTTFHSGDTVLGAGFYLCFHEVLVQWDMLTFFCTPS